MIEVTIVVKPEKGAPATYHLKNTVEAVTKVGKDGKEHTTLAQFQAPEDNLVVKPFGKVYIDTLELAKEAKAKKS